jgi:hypothetical protein
MLARARASRETAAAIEWRRRNSNRPRDHSTRINS